MHSLLLFLLATSLLANESTSTLPDPTRRDVLVSKSVQVVNKGRTVNRSKMKKRSPSFLLQQILISENTRVAVVNGKRVSKGELVRGAKVLQINSDGVVLLINGVPRSVYLASRYDFKEVKR